jgi:hypothetical protein
LLFQSLLDHHYPMSTIISGVYKSILRHTQDLIEEIRATTDNSELRYWAWESRVEENKMPRVDLLGMDGYSFEENKGLWVIRYALGYSSYMDPNLILESETLDIIHEWTGEQKKTPLRDTDTGEEYSELMTVAWQLMPMTSSQYRNYRMIAIELLRTTVDAPGG